MSTPLKQENSVKKKVKDIKTELNIKESALVWIPTIRFKEKKEGRIQSTKKILFPGYCFIGLHEKIDLKRFFMQLENKKRYINILKETKGRGKKTYRDFAQLKNYEIEIIKDMEKCCLEPAIKEYEVGQKVEIAGGMFNGFMGDIIKIKNKKAFVQVLFINSNTVIETSLYDLKKIYDTEKQ